MNTRALDLRRALRLSALSIAWSGAAGSIAVYAALVSGSLSLLGFGADAVIDAVGSEWIIKDGIPYNGPQLMREVKEIVDKANAMIKRVAEEENLDAVFLEATYANPRIDITSKVIKKLDAAQ